MITIHNSVNCGGGDENENKLGNGNTLCARSVSSMVPLVVPLVRIQYTGNGLNPCAEHIGLAVGGGLRVYSKRASCWV